MSYVELHAHSAFSFLDGTSLPHELAGAAAELGHHALALTDHDSVSGSMEFAQAARELDERGVRLRAIHGAELSVRADDAAPAPEQGRPWSPPPLRHLTLLVRNATGWRNLCGLLTSAHAHTRGGDGRGGFGDGDIAAVTEDRHEAMRRDPRRSQATNGGRAAGGTPLRRALEPSVALAEILEHAEGLVCLTGCARRGVHDEPSVRRLREAFGRRSLRVELQRPYLRDDRARNRALEMLAHRLELRTVATGDVHAHTAARARLQDAFVAVREHLTLDASEPLRRGNHSHVLTTPAAMAARFADDHPEAVAETEALAEQLRFDLTSDLGYRYPGAEDAGETLRLRAICQARFEERYAVGCDGVTPALRERAAERLTSELELIAGLELAGFFALHYDILELARKVALEVRGAAAARALLPPGRGRGSSVSSIVCYLTGLSHVDPVANELHLGRFLNEDIKTLPDIDIDFPRDVREALIPRIHDEYGPENSALVAAFPTYRSRGAIRELGKALGLPSGEIERVARSSEGFSARRVDDDVRVALGEGRGADGRWAWLIALAAEAHGLPRHLSQHSGGMIVSTRPLLHCCPIVPAAMAGRQIAMWDKDSCSDAGFLKIDLLGLGMLSAVERCVELIADRRDERVDLSRIPYDDEPTYDAIRRAETTGVFQIESRAQMASLLRTRPRNLDDLTIQVAIVRPGPIQGGAVNPYIERLQRLRADPDYVVPYEHESLREALEPTLGTIIFQDQVIEVAMAFAGFSPGEAEGLRRAMSRKRSAEAVEAFRADFVAGARRLHGVAEDVAQRVYTMVAGFSGFGFPKAHGAAFGLLAYQSTWLRVHYGPELLASLLDEQPMGFYPPDALVHEAQRRGIEVRPPDVNVSDIGCTIEDPSPEARARDGAVRLGLGHVLGVRGDEVCALVDAREAAGPFTSLEDLASRAGAGRPALARLAWAGACDELVADDEPVAGHRRRAALWRLGAALPGMRVRHVAGRSRGRTGAVGGVREYGTQLALGLELPTAPELPTLGSWAQMIADYGTTGVSTAAHPIGLLRGELERRGMVSSVRLRTLDHGAPVRVGGLVVARQRPGTAKGIVFMLLEDELGTVNLIVGADVYERYRLIVRTEPLVMAEGRLERHPLGGGQINIVVRRLGALEAPDRPMAAIKDFSPLDLAELERQAGRGDEDEAPPALAVAGGEEMVVAAGGANDGGGRGGAAPGRDGRVGPRGARSDFRAVAPPVMSFAQGRRR